MNHAETETDILLLAVCGDERQAKERLREMTADELRELRQACSRLDEWLDDLYLEKYQGRRRNDPR